MPVFDFNATPDEKKPAECTYTVIRSNENEATIEKPMMILDNKQCKWEHHSCGVFTNPIKRTSFEFLSLLMMILPYYCLLALLL